MEVSCFAGAFSIGESVATAKQVSKTCGSFAHRQEATYTADHVSLDAGVLVPGFKLRHGPLADMWGS